MESTKTMRLTAGLWILVSGLPILAQVTPVPGASDNIAAVPYHPMEWSIQVRTSGGLNGQGTGGFTATSTGNLSCESNLCNRQIPSDTLQALHRLVTSLDLSRFPVRMPASFCSDCVVTTLALHLADSNHNERTYSVTWDVTTQASLPMELLQIFRASTAIAN